MEAREETAPCAVDDDAGHPGAGQIGRQRLEHGHGGGMNTPNPVEVEHEPAGRRRLCLHSGMERAKQLLGGSEPEIAL